MLNLPISQTAILVVDLQGDFTKYCDGPLPGLATDAAYIADVERATLSLKQAGYPIIATQDWHPANHISFYTNHPNQQPFASIELHGKEQILWPPHAIQHTPGANILISTEHFLHIIPKGTNPLYDSYSAFYDDGANPTPLHAILKTAGITQVVIYGLVTDYCVLATATDAHGLGYTPWVIPSLCRGVNPETAQQALTKMHALGIHLIDLPLFRT